MSAVFAYVTARDRDEAMRIGRALVEGRLAACVNVLPSMTSIYRWEGGVEQAEEAILLIKTGADRIPEVVARVKELHSYSLPCVAVLPIVDGNPDYLEWIRKESRHA